MYTVFVEKKFDICPNIFLFRATIIVNPKEPRLSGAEVYSSYSVKERQVRK
jgi:hypothetical protein